MFRRRRDDAGSMPVALLVTLLGVTLSAGLSGVVVDQIRDTQREADRTAAVAAAQAGLDAGLARIRSAVSVDAGDLEKLPCDLVSSPLSAVGTNSQSYSTSIGYFVIDPSNAIETLRPVGDLTNVSGLLSTNATTPLSSLVGSTVNLAGGLAVPITKPLSDVLNSAVSCVNGALKQVPLYGLLRSVGNYGGVKRTLYATYTFRNQDDTIPGGKIVVAGTNKLLCFGAPNASPAIGDKVTAINCNSADKRVTFIYPKNLSLALSQTRTSKAYPYGLCVTAPLVQFDGAKATFQPCSATSAVLQQWDYDVNQQTYWGGQETLVNGVLTKSRSKYCLSQNTPSVSPGGDVVLKSGTSNCGNADTLGRSFVPDNTVGAGGAGIESNQYVNKDEVGRCLDLTNEDASGGWATKLNHAPALISYPCKQSLNGKPWWNHQWIGPLTPSMIKADVTQAKGVIYTVDTRAGQNNKQWCMKSPGAAGGFVWVGACNANDPNQQWTVYGATTLVNSAYQVVDNYGNCLEAGAKRGPDYVFGGKWSYVITTGCSGKAEQKWNAPTDWKLAPLRSIQER